MERIGKVNLFQGPNVLKGQRQYTWFKAAVRVEREEKKASYHIPRELYYGRKGFYKSHFYYFNEAAKRQLRWYKAHK